MHFENSQALNEYVSCMCNGEAMRAFSTGKDSIVAWLEMRKYFRKVTPIYLYSVPDLEFVERGLRYYEDFFKTRIVRLLHPSVYRQLNNLVFDGLDFRFLAPIKEHYPRDYERILAFFPLADLELKRIEYRREYYASLGE